MDPRAAELPKNRCKPRGQKENLCPFGCPTAALDELGYCRHLLGWTLDGVVVEVMEHVPTSQGSSDTYRRTGVRKDHVLPTDVVVERNTPTSRVYRAVDPSDRRVAPSTRPSDNVSALEALVAEQSKALAAMQDQLAALTAANTPGANDVG